MADVDLNGHRAHVETDGAGPEVVLVHGLTGSVALTWSEVAPALARDHRVVCYDLRGAGRSEVTPGPYSLDLLAADLAALLTATGADTACLVGHSLGGAIALAAAALVPERVARVVTLGVALPLPEPGRQMLLDLAARAGTEGMPSVARTLANLGTCEHFRSRQPERLERFVTAIAAADPGGFAALAHAVAGVELASRLPGVRAPVTLVAASEDELSPPAANEQLAESLAAADVQLVRGSGHEMTLEQPAAVLELIRTAERPSRPA